MIFSKVDLSKVDFSKLTISQRFTYIIACMEIEYARNCETVWEFMIEHEKVRGVLIFYGADITETEKSKLIEEKQKEHFTRSEIKAITKNWENCKNGIVHMRDRDDVCELDKLGFISILETHETVARHNPNNPENHSFTVKLLNI